MSTKRSLNSLFKRRKVNVFLLFVLLALIFSILTKLSKDYTKTVSFKIQPVNIPEDKIIVSDSSYVLKVDLRTYGFKLLRYYFTDPVVNVNIENLDKNDTHYIWTERKFSSDIVSQFDPNVVITNINPDTLKLRYDTNAVKTIPIRLDAKVQYNSGYNVVGDYQMTPDSIRLIGPGVLLDTIHEITTFPLVLNNVKTSFSKEIKLNSIPNNQVRLSDQKITVQATVDKFTEGKVSVPVIVRNVPESINIKIFPKTLDVIFYSSFSEFKDISSRNFIVECDYSAIQQNSTYLTPYIVQKPDQIKSAKLSANKIEFIITE